MRAESPLLELKPKHRFINPELLRRALTHGSLACETRRSLRMRRLILNGLLAIGAGGTCLMAQAAKAPTPKSKAEMEAVLALQAAAHGLSDFQHTLI